MNKLRTWFWFWVAIRMSRFYVWLGDKQRALGNTGTARDAYHRAHDFQMHARRISPARFARYIGAERTPED